MSTTTTLTRKQAEQCVAAVREFYASWFEPVETPGETPLSPYYGPDDGPVLQKPGVQCSGWAVVWEEGPDDWAYQVSMGGSTESEREMMAAAATEFGASYEDVKPAEREPGKFPAGVYVEPVMSMILGLYPA